MKQTKKEMLNGIEEQVEKSRVLQSNTLRVWYKDGSIAVRLHTTDIVTERNGIITLSSGGWKTPTTKDRINTYAIRFGKLPYIYQKNHQWFIGDGIFYDGIQFKDGVQISEVKADNATERNKMLKKISKFCALITEDNLPQPSGGDCWYCLMKDKDGKGIGGNDHLISHMEEGYLVGSLLVNAMLEAGYTRQGQIGLFYSMKIVDAFRKSLRKYLIRRLVK